MYHSVSKKKYNDYFVLKSRCTLFYNEIKEIQSNYVTVISTITRKANKILACETPFWRI